jgi:hypothetical protein
MSGQWKEMHEMASSVLLILTMFRIKRSQQEKNRSIYRIFWNLEVDPNSDQTKAWLDDSEEMELGCRRCEHSIGR